MDIVIIIIAVLSLIGSFNKKAKEKAAKERQEEQRRMVLKAQQMEDPRFPNQAPAKSAPASPYLDTQPPAPATDHAAEAAEAAKRRAEWERKKLLEMQRKEQQAAQGVEGPRMNERARMHAESMEGPRGQERVSTSLKTTVSASSEKRHKLTASSISGHSHMESSLLGLEEDCPPTAAQAQAAKGAKPVAQQPASPLAAELRETMKNRNSLVQGMLIGEILGKPKALRGSER
ncbi:hypothetical protein LJC07_05255 [Christensenellaceae bacterium OttesenSCG-928-L17]|nr:hypothetical protein [Christensenellaceae bacterium OttesenSCG-928-L17]